MISEENIINNIKNSFPDYIGDDTAKISPPKNSSIAITKDLLLENIHFRTSYVDPKSLAYKALYANLSDLVANGAEPKFITLGISIPKSQETYVSQFIDHFTKLCKSEQIIIIGGDTTASQSSLFISITAIGYNKNNNRKTRSGAKENDLVCTVGALGESHLGFLALENKIDKLTKFKKQFLFPKAKIQEGIWLGKHESVTSMMDISDGLFIDLKRLLKASKVRAKINLEKIPSSDDFVKACKILKIDPLITLLVGGEGYGLLFTIKKDHFITIQNQFSNKFNYKFHCIGNIENGEGIDIANCGKKFNLTLKPFSHFGEKI
ncbi:MAG: thiamine-phosphate kinase [Rickettsiales bacterium]|nr:thiamine-phosphate kinase [Rickettsiales bacterium]